MKLSALASEPKLVPITLDDEATVEAYGEPVEFYIHDRQDLDTFMRLASIDDTNNFGALSDVVKELILDENGNQIIQGHNTLPVDVMLKAIEQTVLRLGNSVTRISEK